MSLPSVTVSQWQKIKAYALNALDFSDIAATDCDLSVYIPHYESWLRNGYHGGMEYMARHGVKRYVPAKLVQGTKSVIMVRLNYLPESYRFKNIRRKLSTPSDMAAISCYAAGRDYHKVIRGKLKQLDLYIRTLIPEHQARVFTDSAPVLEKPLAEKAGLGWISKNSNLISEQEGSFFFLGTVYSNLDFTCFQSEKIKDRCGPCQACIKVCPTAAIIKDKVIDARRCISYLTIENKGAIPEEFRHAIGNRIYGCDDCQLVCPMNLTAPVTKEADFKPYQTLNNKTLLALFSWDEATFLKNTEGSPIRRIGYLSWVRNISVALGNAPKSDKIVSALWQKLGEISEPMVQEHIHWAIKQHVH